MRQRELGRTGIRVSEIAFGGVEIGMPYGPHQHERLTESQAISLLQYALDRGITFYDTAREYGQSEQIIGSAFRERRDEIVLCTKCAYPQDEHGRLLPPDKIKDRMEASLSASLKNLRTDYVDVFLCHSADAEIMRSRHILSAFESFKQRGLTRAIGVSTYGFEDTRMAIESGHWDVVQLAFNLLDPSCGRFFATARRHGVGIMARSVLFRGILTDSPFHFHEKLKTIEQHRNQYRALLGGAITSLSDLAMKFVLSFDEVSCVLVGIDKKEFLDQAVAAADGNRLETGLLEKLRHLAYPDPEFLNFRQWRRSGWLD